MNHYDEFKIQYSVFALSDKRDELKELQRKLDPANLNHLTDEEKYQIRYLLADIMAHIKMLEYEVHRPTGEKKNVKKFRFWK